MAGKHKNGQAWQVGPVKLETTGSKEEVLTVGSPKRRSNGQDLVQPGRSARREENLTRKEV